MVHWLLGQAQPSQKKSHTPPPLVVESLVVVLGSGSEVESGSPVVESLVVVLGSGAVVSGRVVEGSGRVVSGSLVVEGSGAAVVSLGPVVGTPEVLAGWLVLASLVPTEVTGGMVGVEAEPPKLPALSLPPAQPRAR